MPKHLKKILAGALLWALIPVLYYGLWHWCRYSGYLWPNKLNIPGFFILIVAWPWSEAAIPPTKFPFLSLAVITFGFGLNISFLVTIAKQVVKRITTHLRTKPSARP
jgi:hypothetical protein